MIYDLQKASMWKRISSFLFDGIMLGILAVLFAWLLSTALRFDRYADDLTAAYARYEEEFGVSFTLTSEEYSALSEEDTQRLNDAYAALNADAQAVRAYNMSVQLTLIITSISLLLAFLTFEYVIPLKLGNGQTLGKKIFSLGVMRTEGVRINGVSLFIRAVLGKFTIETMIPALIIIMIYWGTIGIVGPIVLFMIAAVQLVLMITTRTNSPIHDLLADTVVIDLPSQMIFDTRENLIAYKERVHAEMAARQSY